MNKKLVLFFNVLFFGSLEFVSAQGFGDFKSISNQVVSNVKDILTPLFESLLNTSSYDDFFFAKILLLLLLFVIVSAVVKKVPIFEKTKGMGTLVAAVVSILSVRFISSEGFIAGILLPYGTLGIAITTLLPFFVFFYFIHNSGTGSFGRRISWVLYGIIFVSVWLTRPAGQISDASSWIYFWGIVAVAISLIFDKNIHGYFGMFEDQRARKARTDRLIADTEAKLNNLYNIVDPSDSVIRTIDHLENRLRRLGRRP